jgi:ribose-phosphate pyrophosphokinase
VYPHIAVQNAFRLTDSDIVCYPDKGATVKYTKLYTFPHIFGSKVRDQATGWIMGYELPYRCDGQRVLIVDDICDGGKTFEILTADLFKNGAEEVNLFVTHGIFSKGLRPLYNAGISNIFTNKGRVISMSDGGIGYKEL